MNIAAWSIVWQVVAAFANLSFFLLAAYLSRGAIRDIKDMFHDLGVHNKPGPSNDG